jgi:hypothetical protein
MNHQQVQKYLFDETFLLRAWRRGKALKFLFGKGDFEAVRILVDAVDRSHPSAHTIQEFLARVSSREAVDALVAAWTAQHRPWLGPIAVERALALDFAATLPLDRETAWLVAPHAAEGSQLGAVADAYVQRAIQAQPEFLTAFLFKLGKGHLLPRNRLMVSRALELLSEQDSQVRTGAETWLKALPNAQQWNDLIVDEWIRAQSPFLAGLVAAPRLPSNPAKEALIHLVNRNITGYRRLEDRDGALLGEALAMASPEMRKIINEVVLEAKDGALADAYRRATSAGAQTDPQLALRALMASGNEDALFETARGRTLSEVLPLCRHWSETKRRPNRERPREIVDQAVTAFARMPEVEVEPAPALPDGLRDLFEVWRSEPLSDTQLRQDLQAPDPFVRARGLFLGGERGLVDEKALRAKASSADWPERLIVALRHPDALRGKDHVHWINECAGVEGDLMGVRLERGSAGLERAPALCNALRHAKGALNARNLALAEMLLAFSELFKTDIRITEDDSAPVPTGTKDRGDVSKDDLKF